MRASTCRLKEAVLLCLPVILAWIGPWGHAQELVPDWRHVETSPIRPVVPDGLVNPVITAADVTDAPADFVADPFLFHDDGMWYMFFEAFHWDSGKGRIALATSPDGLNWTYDRIVLSEDWHLSYPCVFKYDGAYYMVPETYQLWEIRLYRATRFPHEWEYAATLVRGFESGRMFNDATIFRYDDKWWIFAGDTTTANLYCFYSDDLLTGWTEHPKSPVVKDDSRIAAPAGRVTVYEDHKIARFGMRNDAYYGEGVVAFRVMTLTETRFEEVRLLRGTMILGPSGEGWNTHGMHHIDPWWNGNHWLCAVDGLQWGVWSIGIYMVPHLSYPNASPVADAGPDQFTLSREKVTLDGSGSTDPDDGIDWYRWKQVSGPSVKLSSHSVAKPRFTAPRVNEGAVSLTFTLTVGDHKDLADVDTVTVVVAAEYRPPVADAGPDQAVREGDEVQLDASGSTDPEDDALSLLWEQVGGTVVTLSDPTAETQRFTAPLIPTRTEDLTFQLSVTNRLRLRDTDTTVVTVSWGNEPPFADAGADQTVPEGTVVTLDGSASTDPDDGAAGIAWYAWEQVAGTPVELSDSTAITPTFIAADVDSRGEVLEFQLSVGDDRNRSSTDTVVVTVTWVNEPPAADAGVDQIVPEGSVVTLDALKSTDPDDNLAFFQWSQTGGPPVELSDVTAAQPWFTAPEAPVNGSVLLTFQLLATDAEGLTASATCTVRVTWVNDGPTAATGPDTEVTEARVFQLDGTFSMDPDDGIASYGWTQTAGPPVALSDPTSARSTFVAPPVGLEGNELAFVLTVVDAGGLEDSSVISVFVRDNGITGFPDDVYTLLTATGEPVGVEPGSSWELLSIAVVDPATLLRPAKNPEELLYGLIALEVRVADPGSAITIPILLPGGVSEEHTWVRYLGPGRWENYGENARYTEARDQVFLTLADGGAGDDDGRPDGRISNTSGAGHAVKAHGSGGGGGGGGGCSALAPPPTGPDILGWFVTVIGSALVVVVLRRRSCDPTAVSRLRLR